MDYERYKADKEGREGRIRAGVIPADCNPELAQAIQDAARDVSLLKDAKKLGRKSKRRAKEIEGIVKELNTAQREEERRYLLRLQEEERNRLLSLLAAETKRRNNNAALAMLMLLA